MRVEVLSRLCALLGLFPIPVGAQNVATGREDPPWVVEDRGKRVLYPAPAAGAFVRRADIVYRADGEERLTMDAYLPASVPRGGSRPAVVLLHGGALPANLLTQPKDWGQFRSLGELIAASGFVAITFNHRFFGGLQALPAAQQDVESLVAFVRQNAQSLGVDPDRITVWAFSGSGLLLAPFIWEPRPYVRSIVSWYAALDPGDAVEAARSRLPADVIKAHSATEAVRSAPGRMPPMLIVRAGLDRPDINRSVDRFLGSAFAVNAPVDLLTHVNGHHGFDIEDDVERTREIVRATLQFIREKSRH